MKNRIVLIFGIASLTAWAIASLAAPQGSVDKGKEVYARGKCSACHSIAGVGNKKAPLDGVGARLTEDMIKKWIKTPKEMKPKAAMRAYPNMADADLANLTAYLLSLKK